jgi:uncharacterized protein (DUF433 family)
VDEIVSVDPEVMGGTPVFTGTRGPIQTLLDYIEGNDTLEAFLNDFPTVSRERAIQFLESAKSALVDRVA